MNMLDSEKIREKIKNLRAEYKLDKDKYSYPPSLEYLENLLKDVKESENEDVNNIFDLYGTLSMEYVRYKMNDKALKILKDRIDAYRDNPLSWIALAEHLIFFEENYQEAKKVSEMAIQVAKEKGKFIRHAYNNLARSSRKLADYSLLENTIKEIMKIRTLPGRGDIGYEVDFLEDLPLGVLDKNLVNEYMKLAKKS